MMTVGVEVSKKKLYKHSQLISLVFKSLTKTEFRSERNNLLRTFTTQGKINNYLDNMSSKNQVLSSSSIFMSIRI